jgi:SAM-dependent methyltransferase
MMDIPYDAPTITPEQMHAAAKGLEDKAFAATVMEKGLSQLDKGANQWLLRLILVAASRLGRADEVLPTYEKFLGWMDLQTKRDWHKEFSDAAPPNNLAAQSGRLGATEQAFQAEFQRTFTNLGPLKDEPILDVGCAGGLWAIGLARNGFRAIGTDHHAGIIERAQQNAKASGLDSKLTFLVDDAQNSRLSPSFYCSRVLCISVTPCLPNDAAFDSLIAHLDRASRPVGAAPGERRVILGHNRWGPSWMSAVNAILAAFPGNYALIVNKLLLTESTWWLHPRHIETIRRRFPNVTEVGTFEEETDGIRVDLLLQ